MVVVKSETFELESGEEPATHEEDQDTVWFLAVAVLMGVAVLLVAHLRLGAIF